MFSFNHSFCSTMFRYLYSLCLLGFFLQCTRYASVAAYDEPLVVTPYLEGPQASVDEALSLSEVRPDILTSVKSYSGFFNVNKDCGKNLFYWFFPADADWEKKPVILWLQGIPGASIMAGVFEEVGPLTLLNGKLVNMDYAWTLEFNVLFIDQPVGSGFSFAEKECPPESVESTMQDTLTALNQFFVMFHQLKTNQFYITGGYFVSHYGPVLAREILENNKKSDESNKVNLKGVLIMNGRTTAKCQDFSNILYQLGIIDQKNRDEFKTIHNQIVEKVEEHKFLEAIKLENNMLKKLKDDSRLPSLNNFNEDDEVIHYFINFLNSNDIKKRIHVGNQRFNSFNVKVRDSLLPEYYSSPKEGIEYILNRDDIFVGFYQGQMDIIYPYSAANCFLKTIAWPSDKDFTKVRRDSLSDDDDKTLGWKKSIGNFFHVLVRKAGRYSGADLGETNIKILQMIFKPIQSNRILQRREQKKIPNQVIVLS